jgi:GNS1/SUR4 family.
MVTVLTFSVLEYWESDSLWNHGIDYYMWMFYMSKFYEVVDTILLLMKGRKSSFLQTYHHAGVILCTWAGVRYVSPPAVVGLLLNSMIHTIMVSDESSQVSCSRIR